MVIIIYVTWTLASESDTGADPSIRYSFSKKIGYADTVRTLNMNTGIRYTLNIYKYLYSN